MKKPNLLPPRLSMAEYARFVSENWETGDMGRIRRQKEIEERIETPFRMPPEERILAEKKTLRNL